MTAPPGHRSPVSSHPLGPKPLKRQPPASTSQKEVSWRQSLVTIKRSLIKIKAQSWLGALGSGRGLQRLLLGGASQNTVSCPGQTLPTRPFCSTKTPAHGWKGWARLLILGLYKSQKTGNPLTHTFALTAIQSSRTACVLFALGNEICPREHPPEVS